MNRKARGQAKVASVSSASPATGNSNQARTIAAVVVALGIALFAVYLESRRAPAIFFNHRLYLEDSDDYLRLHRVRLIQQHGGIIRRMHDINYPFGAESHWTAPMDYLLAGAARLFSPLTSQPDPLGAVAAWVPVALGAVYIGVLVNMLRRSAGWPPALLAAFLVALSAGWHRPFRLGHCDHHCLAELCCMIGVAGWIAKRDAAGAACVPSRNSVIISGLFIGLAIWVAIQAMFAWVAILIGAVYASYRATGGDQRDWWNRFRTWNIAVLGVVTMAWLIERWGILGSLSVDKISLLHPLIVGGALLVPSPDPERRFAPKRWIAFAFAAAAGAILVAVRSADVFQFVRSDEFFRFSNNLSEDLPLYSITPDDFSLVRMHRFLGLLPYALPVLIFFFWRCREIAAGPKMTLSILCIGVTVMAIRMERWLDHENIGTAAVLAVGCWQLGVRLTGEYGRRPVGAMMVAFIILLAIICFPALGELVPRRSEPELDLKRCTAAADRINLYQRQNQPSPDGRVAILSDEDQGPQLLYLTGLPVVAVTQHRAIQGMITVANFFSQRDPAAARAILDERRVRFIVTPDHAEEQLMYFEERLFGKARSFDPPGLEITSLGTVGYHLKFRPELSKTMCYRLTMTDGQDIPGIEPILKVGAKTGTARNVENVVYVVH